LFSSLFHFLISFNSYLFLYHFLRFSSPPLSAVTHARREPRLTASLAMRQFLCPQIC
jgi:hypothetical protein